MIHIEKGFCFLCLFLCGFVMQQKINVLVMVNINDWNRAKIANLLHLIDNQVYFSDPLCTQEAWWEITVELKPILIIHIQPSICTFLCSVKQNIDSLWDLGGIICCLK